MAHRLQVFIDPDDSTSWLSILWVMGPDGKFESDHTIYGDTFEECARVAKSFIQGESRLKTLYPDPKLNKELLDSLAENLISTPDYIHMPGMRVWQVEYGWLRLGDIKSVQWPPRAECTIPDLCDFPTIGCLMQQAWRIVEREKEIAISKKRKFPPYMITSDMVMGNLDAPLAISHWCEAMRHFALNGLTDINGLSHLVDVFKSVDV